MKKVLILTLILVGGVFLKVYAADVQVNNKICPISHEEVGKNGMKPFIVSYNGKSYYLCCSMCEKDFKKDPAKYTKIMEDEVAAEQTGQAKKM